MKQNLRLQSKVLDPFHTVEFLGKRSEAEGLKLFADVMKQEMEGNCSSVIGIWL